VRTDRLVCEYPHGLPEDSVLTLERNLSIPWVTRDISKSGVIGDATAATREKGDRIWESLAQGWAKTIVDVHRFQQPQRWKED
jgi:creatinine amidohydrolase